MFEMLRVLLLLLLLPLLLLLRLTPDPGAGPWTVPLPRYLPCTGECWPWFSAGIARVSLRRCGGEFRPRSRAVSTATGMGNVTYAGEEMAREI